MEALWGWEIIEAVQGLHRGGKKDCLLSGVCTDTRLLKGGELFVALQGKKYDGHAFIPQAIEKGASGLLVSRDTGITPSGVLVVEVKDTLEALGRLARYYKEKLPVKIVAVTGSNGKTSTKEMLHHLLSHSFTMVSTPGNYNNFVGVPLSLFQLEPYHELAVIEMGTSAPGEIRWLSWIARPEIGVITNVSEAHLEGLGDVEGVAMAKAELLENVVSGGHLVFNADNPWCQGMARTFPGRVTSFGLGEGSHIKGSELKEHEGGTSFVVNGRHKVYLRVPGLHNVYNALAALAVGYCLGLNLEELSLKLGDFCLPPMRMERHQIGEIAIINDAYNANPASMAAALAEFSRMDVSGQRCLICGDMAELGKEAVRLHMELGEMIARASVDLLLVIGCFATEIASAARRAGMGEWQIKICNNQDEVCQTAMSHLKKGDALLIKGSRCMRLEEVFNRLKARLSNQAQEGDDKVLALSEERVRS
jgi:UDP-N-acetylmuramoyl-tripeptide--D-alanyl-D-alanine ligase